MFAEHNASKIIFFNNNLNSKGPWDGNQQVIKKNKDETLRSHLFLMHLQCNETSHKALWETSFSFCDPENSIYATKVDTFLNTRNEGQKNQVFA